MSNTSKVLFVVGLLVAGLAAAPTHAQRCPSLSIGECRKTAAEGGDLLHEPNANGQLIWTTKCGPNTFRAPADKVCGGTVVSRLQYLHDVRAWGFRDVRHDPRVHMSEKDIALWTAAALGQEAGKP